MVNILGLDISTKAIGITLLSFSNGDFEVKVFEGLELKLSKRKYTEDDMEGLNKLFHKADLFKDRMNKIKEEYSVDYISIEESLVNSNNLNTVAILNRFNGMVSQIAYEVFDTLPIFNSVHTLRSNALPSLVTVSKYLKSGLPRSAKDIEKDERKGNKVLFGGYKQNDNKKEIIMNELQKLYSDKLPELTRNKNGNIEEKWYDASDSFVCALGLYKASQR